MRDIICKQCSKVFQGAGKRYYCSRPCSDMNQYEARMFEPEYRIGRLLSMAKNRSAGKDLLFDIDVAHLLELWHENSGSCAITGIPFELGRSEKGKVHPYAPSLDRIIPSKGYTKGNVRIVCYQMNIAISEFGLEQFDELVSRYIAAR